MPRLHHATARETIFCVLGLLCLVIGIPLGVTKPQIPNQYLLCEVAAAVGMLFFITSISIHKKVTKENTLTILGVVVLALISSKLDSVLARLGYDMHHMSIEQLLGIAMLFAVLWWLVLYYAALPRLAAYIKKMDGPQTATQTRCETPGEKTRDATPVLAFALAGGSLLILLQLIGLLVSPELEARLKQSADVMLVGAGVLFLLVYAGWYSLLRRFNAKEE